MHIEVLKKLDVVVGAVLVRLLPTATGEHSMLVPPKEILVIRPGGIGDAALLIPVLNCLKETLTGTTITILAEKRNAAVFSLCPSFDKVLLYDTPKGIWKVISSKYDVVIDTEQWHKLSAVLARLTRAPFLIGYNANERKKLFSYAVPYTHDDLETDSFFNLFALLGIEKPPEIKIPFLKVPAESEDKIRRILADFVEQAFVVIFPGASIKERRWGAIKFREVAERLHSKRIPVVVVGGKEDVPDGDLIVSDLPRAINLSGKTTLPETAAVIAKATILVSGDSGILHIGVGLGTPTVSLFGPGIANKWAPRGDKHIVINKHLPCSPCTKFGYTPRCPINARCMSEITVDEVTNAVVELIKRHGTIP